MAGTVTAGAKRRGTLDGSKKPLLAFPFDFTADAVDGSFPQRPLLADQAGRLAGIRVIFDDGTPPDNLDVKVSDIDGVDLLGGSGSGFTGTGKVTLGPPEQFVRGLTLDLSGNTVNLAGVRIVVNVF